MVEKFINSRKFVVSVFGWITIAPLWFIDPRAACTLQSGIVGTLVLSIAFEDAAAKWNALPAVPSNTLSNLDNQWTGEDGSVNDHDWGLSGTSTTP